MILACGERVARNLITFIPKHKVRVLSNAMSIPSPNKRETDCWRESLALTDETVLLSLGSLSHHKGYDIMVKAMESVKGRCPRVLLLIGGEGSERESLGKLISDLDLRNCVRLLGLVDNVHALFPLVDIYVNSSRREGLPMALLEAAAHGKPMVATDVGGNSEVVQDGETGLLVPPEDSLSFANAMCRLIGDSQLRFRMGKVAYTLYQEQYTIEKHCAALASIYLG